MDLKYNQEEIIKMYCEDLIPLQDIANKFNKTRMGVKYFLNKLGIDTSKKIYKVNCKVCLKEFTRNKKRIRNALTGLFCSNDCYIKHLRDNAIGITNRQAQRLSRKLMTSYCKDNNINILPTNIVHHIDGNDFNMDIHNLMLLRSQADHIMIHRHYGNPIIIVDGSNLE